jgi:hypothetical protein
MIGRRMAGIIKRLARHRDDMRLAKFKRVIWIIGVRERSAIALSWARLGCCPLEPPARYT